MSAKRPGWDGLESEHGSGSAATNPSKAASAFDSQEAAYEAFVAARAGDLGTAVGFLPNLRIQVLWTIDSGDDEEDGEDGEDGGKEKKGEEPESKSEDLAPSAAEPESGEREVWWPATVLGKTSRTHVYTSKELSRSDTASPKPNETAGSPSRLPTIRSPARLPRTPGSNGAAPESEDVGGPKEDQDEDPITLAIYEIRYDAMPPDFPDASYASVCVLDDHHVLNIEDDSVLPWRVVDSPWEEEEVDDEVGASSPNKQKRLKLAEKGNADDEIRKRRLVEVCDLLQAENDYLLQAISEGTLVLGEGNDPKAEAEKLVDGVIESLQKKYETYMGQLPASTLNIIVDRVRRVRDKLLVKIEELLSERGAISTRDAEELVRTIREDEESEW